MILPPATLGMLGGGQLGRFFVIAAHEMGYRALVLDPDPHSPAGRIADQHLVAAYDDADALDRVGATCAAVTTEFENVPADTMAHLSKYVPVRPSAHCVAVAQNREREKTFLRDNGFPVGPFAVIRGESDIDAIGDGLLPGVLKIARFGYDGKGQTRIATRDDVRIAFHHFKNEACVLERFLPLDVEVSVVLARGQDGQARCFAVAENRHRHGILDVSIVPARISDSLRGEAEELALTLAHKLDYIGVLGVEFFVSNGKLLVNEIAPRPHNSGHYTIDACVTNQFEQQVRVLCGLPLGDARLHTPAAMVNLLGDVWHAGEPRWDGLLLQPGIKLHLYGKHHARPGRKMGHFTALDTSVERAVELALAARRRIGIGIED
ncbi:MAG: 5-(carboxyamino)imidazole ribonucleotide synthase [Sterolibacteriaceae bacterium]|nr:5-(carboxyamino)imidazole ribonucleotide synthase [Sterolibacteriaceae bacterium]